MLKKILLIILVLSVSPVFAQKSKKRTKGRLSPEIAIEAAKKAANDAANNPIENTPILNNSSIRGKVFYEDDGKPVRRSSIVLFRKSGGGEEQVLTDENGNFEVSKVAQGIYYPMVNSPGAISLFSYIDFAKVAAQKGEDEIFDDAFKQAQKITVDGKTDLQVDIPVKRGGIVSGKVTYPDGSPATGRPIQVLRKIDGKFQPVVSNFFALFLSSAGTGTYYETDEKGNYRFSGLPAGEYFVRANEPASHGEKWKGNGGGPDSAIALLFASGTFLNTFYPNTNDVSLAKAIKVENGKESSGIDVVLRDWKLHRISGRLVSGKDGKPLKATVYINEKNPAILKIPTSDSRRNRSFTQTDDNGNWGFKDIPKGDYTIFVEPSNSEIAVVEAANAATIAANESINAAKSKKTKKTPKSTPIPTLNQRFAKIFKDVKVEDSNIENVEIKAYYSATILGSMELPAGNMPETPVNIEALNEDGEVLSQEFVYLSKLNEKQQLTSSFGLNDVPIGKFKLRITTSDKNIIVKSATVHGVDLLNNVFELSEGQILKDVKITLERKK